MKKKITIAEDDMGILFALQFMLEEEGYDVTTNDNGNNLKTFSKNIPDLLLLDIWMPGTNGTNICKHLKSKKLTKNIPIIICSANQDSKKLAKACGANDFISKPFDIDELLAKVSKNISNSKSNFKTHN